MTESEKLSVSIYSIAEGLKDTVSLPTPDTVEKTTFLSAILFGCSLVSEAIGMYTFISCQGAGLCTLVLGVLLYMERSENNALSRMYRNARVSSKKDVRRAKSSGSSKRGGRSTDSNRSTKQKAGKRKKPSNNSKNKRHS